MKLNSTNLIRSDNDLYAHLKSFLLSPLTNFLLFRVVLNKIVKIIFFKVISPFSRRILQPNYLRNKIYFRSLKQNAEYLLKYFDPISDNVNYSRSEWEDCLKETGWVPKPSKGPEQKKFLINLASQKFNVSHLTDIQWDNIYRDKEDTMSLHRFDWLIRLVVENGRQILIDEGVDCIVDWWRNNKTTKQTIALKKSSRESIAWQSYTVSERIVNWTIFFCAIKPYYNFTPKIQKLLDNAIYFHLNYLKNNLEFIGSKTNNHIINNARALYIGGIIFKYKEFKDMGRLIIKNEWGKHFSSGVLNEGSTHYQLLLTRSMIEIGWFASENGDKDFEKWVTNQTESMVRVCRFLNLGNKQNIIPRWSDISPDYPPQWLFGYPFTMNYSEESDLSPWAKIWGDLYTTKKSKSYHYDLRKINSKNQYGHWIKYELKPFKIFTCCRPNNIRSHTHQDDGSFCLYFNDKPVLTDPGQNSYVWKSKISIQQALLGSHNTISINDVGCRPSKLSLLYDLDQFVKEPEAILNENILNFYNKGFRTNGGWITWNRLIEIDRNKVIVNDSLKNINKDCVVINFVFSSSIKLKLKSSMLYGESKDFKFSLDIKSDDGLKHNSTKHFNIIDGFSSKEYGHLGRCKIFRSTFDDVKETSNFISEFNFK